MHDWYYYQRWSQVLQESIAWFNHTFEITPICIHIMLSCSDWFEIRKTLRVTKFIHCTRRMRRQARHDLFRLWPHMQAFQVRALFAEEWAVLFLDLVDRALFNSLCSRMPGCNSHIVSLMLYMHLIYRNSMHDNRLLLISVAWWIINLCS